MVDILKRILLICNTGRYLYELLYTEEQLYFCSMFNNERVKLYDNDKLTIVDAVMQVGFPNEKLFPRRGKELNFTVNGKVRLVRGQAGEGAVDTVKRQTDQSDAAD